MRTASASATCSWSSSGCSCIGGSFLTHPKLTASDKQTWQRWCALWRGHALHLFWLLLLFWPFRLAANFKPWANVEFCSIWSEAKSNETQPHPFVRHQLPQKCVSKTFKISGYIFEVNDLKKNENCVCICNLLLAFWLFLYWHQLLLNSSKTNCKWQANVTEMMCTVMRPRAPPLLVAPRFLALPPGSQF